MYLNDLSRNPGMSYLKRRYARTFKGNDIRPAKNPLNNRNLSAFELDYYMAGDEWILTD